MMGAVEGAAQGASGAFNCFVTPVLSDTATRSPNFGECVIRFIAPKTKLHNIPLFLFETDLSLPS